MKSTKRTSGAYQIIYLISGIIQVFLGLRFIFKLLNANRSADFTQFLYGVTRPLISPFRSIFPVESVEGAVFEWSTLVAMLIYSLAAWVLVRILSITFSTAEDDTTDQ